MLYSLPRCCSCIKVLKQFMSKMKKALLPFCLIPLIATSSHAVCLESEPEKYNYQGSYGETEVKVTLESGGKKFQCKSLGKYGIEVPYYNVYNDETREMKVHHKCADQLYISGSDLANKVNGASSIRILSKGKSYSGKVLYLANTVAAGNFNTPTYQHQVYNQKCLSSGESRSWQASYKIEGMNKIFKLTVSHTTPIYVE